MPGLDQMHHVLFAGIEPGAVEREGRAWPQPQPQHIREEGLGLRQAGGLDRGVIDVENLHAQATRGALAGSAASFV